MDKTYIVNDGNNEYMFTFIAEPVVNFASEYTGNGAKFYYTRKASEVTLSINGKLPIPAWKLYKDNLFCDENLRLYSKILVETFVDFSDFQDRILILLEAIMSEDDLIEFMSHTFYDFKLYIDSDGPFAYNAPFPPPPQISGDTSDDDYDDGRQDFTKTYSAFFIFHDHNEMLDFGNRHNIAILDIPILRNNNDVNNNIEYVRTLGTEIF
jgi:hypothetical protein